MKKLLYYILPGIMLTGVYSCSKIDNYPNPPSETLTGSVIDSVTGEPMQTEIGSGGIRIRLDELSWSDDPTPYYFYAMEDGTFKNTKIFNGKYRITVEGPFVPLIRNDSMGNVIVDKSKTMEISGVTEVNFTVEPFLEVSWVKAPVFNADGTISANIKFVRGTDNPAYQADITDVYLFVNPGPYSYVGNNNFDPRYSTHITYNGSEGNDKTGQTITITSSGGALPANRSYYVRVGVRTAYGLKKYNYTETQMVEAP